MKAQKAVVRRSFSAIGVLFCVGALTACAAEDTGNNNNPVVLAGAGGAGAVGGASGIGGGVGGMGTAGQAGMMIVGGVGGAGGTGAVAGVGGAAGDVTAGIGGMGGGGVGGMAGGEGGMGGGGVGGMAGGEGGAGGGSGHEDQGMGDGQDVITMGDSYMRLNPTEGIEVSLETVSGRDYRNYGVAGTMMLDEVIPNQFKAAVRDNPNIKTVVITGGGNDILIGNIFCTTNWTPNCEQTVRDVAQRHTELRAEMAAAGVQDVIYINYGYAPIAPAADVGLDLSVELATAACTEEGMPRCHFINPIDMLAGKIRSDNIHPNAEGYMLLGEKVWEVMQAEGVRR